MTEQTDELIARVLNGEASLEDIRKLADWVRADERHAVYFRQWKKVWHLAHERQATPERREEALRQFVAYMRRPQPAGRLRRMVRWISSMVGVAALVAVVLYTGLRESGIPPLAEPPVQVVQLVLSDGSRHELTGENAVQDVAAVLESDTVAVPVTEYNEVIVPSGTTYTFSLPDGTSVVLNAESRLKFPTVFGDAERRIALSGEAYFEVARDEAHPFFVEFSTGSVQVLGTQFNMSAYDGTLAFAVLVSGKVRVASGEEAVDLQPGQLCELHAEGLTVGRADLMSVLAWKNGEFVFKEASWKQVMDELARWYDADIRYNASEMEGVKLHIYMERTATLPEALEIIARMVDISYSVEGRKVIIKRR